MTENFYNAHMFQVGQCKMKMCQRYQNLYLCKISLHRIGRIVKVMHSYTDRKILENKMNRSNYMSKPSILGYCSFLSHWMMHWFVINEKKFCETCQKVWEIISISYQQLFKLINRSHRTTINEKRNPNRQKKIPGNLWREI